ncbi:hypothetical protein, partial [Coxiella burnetii]|uniref:hypothetical protein n=1 Tax=Coxiella burnetii TaxID=777 RepID=UPI002232203F
ENLFGKGSAAADLDPVLERLVAENPGVGRFRAHIFARTMAGIWACSDPSCPEAAGNRSQPSNVGKLYSRPLDRCACGAVVLELLYCGQCGVEALGGFVVDTHHDLPLLSATASDPATSERLVFARTQESYRWYLPGRHQLTRDAYDRTVAGQKRKFSFVSAEFNPRAGLLAIGSPDPSGVALTAAGDSDFAALPVHCPRCDHRLTQSDPTFARVRSALKKKKR